MLFINVFKGKIFHRSITDILSIRVPKSQKHFYFSVISEIVLQLGLPLLQMKRADFGHI
jgi:hypothetical protein